MTFDNALLPLFGGIIIFFSFAGLGLLFRRLLGAAREAPFSTVVATGIAVVAFVLSILSLFHAITLPAVLVLEGVGLIALAAERRTVIEQFRAAVRTPYWWILFAVLAFVYMRSVCALSFEVADDITGYLPIIEKVVQTGGLGQDPFSLYRLQAGLGAYLLLQSVFALQFGYYNLSLLNPAFGIVIGTLAAVEYSRNILPPRVLIVLGIAVAGALAIPDPNFTPHALLAGMTIVCLIEVLSKRLLRLPDIFCGAFIAGAILSLKITQLPLLMIVAGAWLYSGWMDRRDAKRLALIAIVAIAGAVIVMAPGMFALHQTAGTYLFPVLGIGYYGSAYGTIAYTSDGVTVMQVVKSFATIKRGIVALAITAALCGAVSFLYWRKKNRDQPTDMIILALALSALPLMALISYAGAADPNATRYAFPTFISIDTISAVWILQHVFGGDAMRQKKNWSFAVCIFLTLSFLGIWTASFLMQSYVNLMFLGLADPTRALEYQNRYIPLAQTIALTDRAEQSAVHNAQTATRPGAAVLTFLQRWNGLDFRRNEIWNTSHYVGAMSPPPGLPLDGSGQKVRDYLRSVGVSYVIFQYAGPEPTIDADIAGAAHGTYAYSRWNVTLLSAAARGRPMFSRLMSVTPVVYKDAKFVTLQIR